MQPSMKRLMECAKTDRKSDIARDLNVGASTVTNWVNRGVSKEGALAAAEKYNADANYILDGTATTRTFTGRPTFRVVNGFNEQISDEEKEAADNARQSLNNSSASVVDLMNNLSELENLGGLTPEAVRLLNATIETFKMVAMRR